VKDWKQLLGPLRVDFLWMDAACVLLGWGAAAWGYGQVNLGLVFLTFLGALAAHISVNAFNEYFDFGSGLDQKAGRTPFSGGSGTLQQRPELARWALGVAVGTLILTAAIGLFLVYLQGWELIPIGVVGLFVIVAYTPWLTHHPLSALLACGFGFGTLMINGTNFALTGGFTWTAFTASMIEFFQGNALLILNQFPDVDADRAVGRRNLPILLGRRASSVIYGLFLLATYLSLVVGIWLGHLPLATSLGLLTLPLAVSAAAGVYRYAEDVPRLVRSMGFNVLLNITTPIWMAAGLFIAAWAGWS